MLFCVFNCKNAQMQPPRWLFSWQRWLSNSGSICLALHQGKHTKRPHTDSKVHNIHLPSRSTAPTLQLCTCHVVKTIFEILSFFGINTSVSGATIGLAKYISLKVVCWVTSLVVYSRRRLNQWYKDLPTWTPAPLLLWWMDNQERH